MSWRFAAWSRGTMSAALSWREASLAGSSSTRSCRRSPPMSVVSATSGTCFTASSTSATMRRSV